MARAERRSGKLDQGPPDVMFEGTILAGHKEAAIEIRFDPAVRWKIGAVAIRAGRRGHPVRAAVDGVHFDSFIVARSKRFWLLLDLAILTKLDRKIGDAISGRLSPA